jgi:hypothetical protein
VKPKGFSGGKKVQQKAGGLMLKNSPLRRVSGSGSKLRKPLKTAAKPAASKRPAKANNRIPKAVQAVARAAAATFVAGQAARRMVSGRRNR